MAHASDDTRQASLVAVCTTVASRLEAESIARALVERQLAACAQISEIHSIYRWNGRLQEGCEWRILLKSTSSQYAAVESAIRELHPYELPAIYAVAVEHAFAPYAEWVAAGSSGQAFEPGGA